MFQMVCDQDLLKYILDSNRHSEPPKYCGVEVQMYDIQIFLQEYGVCIIDTLNIVHPKLKIVHPQKINSWEGIILQ